MCACPTRVRGLSLQSIENGPEKEVFNDLPTNVALYPAVFCDYTELLIDFVESFELKPNTGGQVVRMEHDPPPPLPAACTRRPYLLSWFGLCASPTISVV